MPRTDARGPPSRTALAEAGLAAGAPRAPAPGHKQATTANKNTQELDSKPVTAKGGGARGPSPPRPSTFYVGTSVELALAIQERGFNTARTAARGENALLGAGVYCTPVLSMAVAHARTHPSRGAVLELYCDLGRCRALSPDDPLMTTWQQHGFDSAWAPPALVAAGFPEACIKLSASVSIVRVLAGDTAALRGLGLAVRGDGKLVALPAAPAPKPALRKRARCEEGAEQFAHLLRAWKLHDVMGQLAAEGVTDVAVLRDELPPADIERLPLGRVYKTRLTRLVEALHGQRDLLSHQTARALALLERLRETPTSAAVCAALADDEGTAVAPVIAALVARGAVAVVLASVAAPAASADLLDSALVMVSRLAASAHRGELVASGASAVVLRALHAHPRAALVQRRGLGALRRLLYDERGVLDPANALAVGQARGVRVVVAAMRAHGGHAMLQENACRLLFELAIATTTRAEILREGGVPAVLAAMTAHAGQPRLLLIACRALLRSLYNTPPGAPGGADAGVVLALLAAMRAHAQHGALQVRACCVLAAVCKRGACQDALLEGAGVPVLLAAIGAHTKSMCVGLFVLNTLCHTASSRAAIVAGGGVGVLLGAVDAHAGDARLVQQCLLCLCNIAICAAHRAVIVGAGAVARVLAAMATHRAHLLVQQHGCGLLQNLAVTHPERRGDVAAAGAAGPVLEAMRSHPGAPRMQAIGSLLLRTLAMDPDTRGAIVRAGGIALVLAALTAHRALAPNQKHGCDALHNFVTGSEDFQLQLMEAGGAVLIAEAMLAHPASSEVVLSACFALRVLVAHAACRTALADSGGIRLLLDAMVRHSADLAVCENACVILCGIGWSEALLQRRIRDAGGGVVLAQAASLPGGSGMCRQLASDLLRKIALV